MSPSATIKERLVAFVLEARNLHELSFGTSGDNALFIADVLGDLATENFDVALAKARGEYESPDPPGWEGGFAENH